MITNEDLKLIEETQAMCLTLDRWFKRLDKESHNNLFNLVKRQDQIKTMKVKEYYTMKELAKKYSEVGSDFHKEYNILIQVSEELGAYNLVVKDKFIIQMMLPSNSIEVRLYDISTLYGTHVIYEPNYYVSAREIVETIKETLNIK